jgi:Fe-S cluster biogenesis protein NfuA
MTARDFQDRLQRLDGLLQQTEQAVDPVARAQVREIVHLLLSVHGAALARLLECLETDSQSADPVRAICARDEVVSGLLLLHDLHPLDVEARVHIALDGVRPMLRAHGQNLKVMAIDDHSVRLRLQRSGHTCSSSIATMQQTIEEAIYARAPEITSIEVDGLHEVAAAPENGRPRLALPVL